MCVAKIPRRKAWVLRLFIVQEDFDGNAVCFFVLRQMATGCCASEDEWMMDVEWCKLKSREAALVFAKSGFSHQVRQRSGDWETIAVWRDPRGGSHSVARDAADFADT